MARVMGIAAFVVVVSVGTIVARDTFQQWQATAVSSAEDAAATLAEAQATNQIAAQEAEQRCRDTLATQALQATQTAIALDTAQAQQVLQMTAVAYHSEHVCTTTTQEPVWPK